MLEKSIKIEEIRICWCLIRVHREQKMKETKGKKIISDFLNNILATILVTLVLQVIVYPFFAATLSSVEYGRLLTIMGIANIFTVSLGGGLNNVRLIQRNLYDEIEEVGDFSLILVIFLVLGTALFGFIARFNFGIKGGALACILAYVSMGIVINYLVVSFRIVVDYKANLIYNIFLGTGYLLGVLLVRKNGFWSLAFLLGEVIGFLYLLRATTLYKERIGRTKLFANTFKNYLVLISTNIVANIIIYLDRIFLYPILGGEQVTIYTVASFVGKSIGLVITPVASVLLSYYAQKSFVMTVKKYWLINGITLLGGGILGVMAIVFGPIATKILYPTVYEEAREYLVIANVASLIGVLSNIISPSILKFANIYWQIVIQLLYAGCYVFLGYICMMYLGLWGFCIATLIVNLFRMFLLMVIGHISILKVERE